MIYIIFYNILCNVYLSVLFPEDNLAMTFYSYNIMSQYHVKFKTMHNNIKVKYKKLFLLN